jgi:7-cyano-7-deazaguanine tRNA-ribosyltransferase
MSFELRDRDLLGRIGKLKTKSGTIETPAFMPVINPIILSIPPKQMKKDFGCNIIITNSYITWNHFGDIPNLKIHKLLEYDGIIATDSGAYQILVYGKVKVTQEEIIRFQKQLGTDIGVILDIPSGWDVPRSQVQYTVEETLKRAREALPLIRDTPNLWVGPIQGGKYLDLLAKSAREISEMPFQIYALGSPTEVMERYMFPVLVDMTLTAKMNIPVEKPLHLFGAGHPMMLALGVAMGCDLFDSAAYAIFAKNDRYFTNRGTILLKDLRYLPCSCPICSKHSAQEIRELTKGERQRKLTEHNLFVTMTEIEIIKQSITEGRLLDLVEARAKGHPKMTEALKRFSKYKNKIEKNSSGFKGHGVFYYDYHSLIKPEITRYINLLKNNYRKPVGMNTLLLMTRPNSRPFNTNPAYIELKKKIDVFKTLHRCFYAAPYGIIPDDLSETYPLSQFEIAEPLDHETMEFTINQILNYIENTNHQKIIVLSGKNPLDERLQDILIKKIEKKRLQILVHDDPWTKKSLDNLLEIITNPNQSKMQDKFKNKNPS